MNNTYSPLHKIKVGTDFVCMYLYIWIIEGLLTTTEDKLSIRELFFCLAQACPDPVDKSLQTF